MGTDAMPFLSVTKTSQDAVKFEVVGKNDVRRRQYADDSCSGLQHKRLRFEGAGFRLTSPPILGTAPTDAEAVGTGEASVSGGAIETKDDVHKKLTSTRTITVPIKNMDVGGLCYSLRMVATDKKAEHQST